MFFSVLCELRAFRRGAEHSMKFCDTISSVQLSHPLSQSSSSDEAHGIFDKNHVWLSTTEFCETWQQRDGPLESHEATFFVCRGLCAPYDLDRLDASCIIDGGFIVWCPIDESCYRSPFASSHPLKSPDSSCVPGSCVPGFRKHPVFEFETWRFDHAVDDDEHRRLAIPTRMHNSTDWRVVRMDVHNLRVNPPLPIVLHSSVNPTCSVREKD